MDYPAKILLFGEYGIILNSMALAIPYPRFSGHFSFSTISTDNQSQATVESNYGLKKLLTFFKINADKFQFINLELFEDETNQGLFFDSSVPVGSGLGSSGALTAAIFERYLNQAHKNDYQLIKTQLGAIETCFHGKSSGFDPLISLLKRPVMIDDHSSIIVDFKLTPFFTNFTLFLINTHSKENTGALVNNFIDNYSHQEFKKSIDNEYIPLINQVVEAVVESDFVTFDKLISMYSEFQLTHFRTMIPQRMRTYFEHGIDSGDFHLKICGSGGGGYIIGIASDRLKAESYFSLNQLDWTVVNPSEQ